jgi:hypothetical protein
MCSTGFYADETASVLRFHKIYLALLSSNFLMLDWTSRTLATISSAVAVQTNGSALLFQWAMVVTDAIDEDLYRAERAAANRLAGDDAEPGLNLIDPGRPDGSEEELNVRVLLQPGLHLRGGVGRKVVQYDVNLLVGVRLDGLLEERQEGVAVAAGPDSPKTSPAPTFNAANRFVVPCRT